MENLTDWIREYYEEHGYSEETTRCIIRDIEDALLDHAIVANIEYTDENNYNI